VGHDVAPVTCRVANRKKYWLAGGACESKRFRTPWKPINWVIAMLAKVWTDLVTQAIGHVTKR